MTKEITASNLIRKVAIVDLIPYANNSRVHSDEQVNQIAASIREFGFLNPIIIDGDNGIIAGHGRVMAANKLGVKELPCVDASHLSPAQKKAYVIADNKIALNSDWDNELLRVELEGLQELDFDLSLTGFNEDELGDLLNVELLPEYEEDADGEVIEPPAEPKTKEGDVWILGKHRLMCGDSTSIDALEKLCNNQLVDMWLTDPPYNVAYEGKTKDALTIKNDSMGDDDFRQFLRDCYVAADAVMKPGAAFYIWHADSEGYNFRGAAKDANWKVRQCLIWKKSTLVMGRQDYHWKHEPCLYGWKDGAGHLWASDRKQTTILEFDKPSRNGEHPTMKPVELFEYCLMNNTKGGDIVLDSFGGSGTTMIACEKSGRTGYLMELDPKYCDVIINRWQTLTGKDAVLESTGDKFNDI
ncbi:site-specific DNA-methyltransferase [Acinetobacter sp. FDAARGOS_515]|uniref:site-specific DNA-methyltransferase n=1 Tax=Acinetobacter sp. FDAARGOS_515 TaxID=2420307 RepID=UPI000F68245A|nr:site-specific DNA-methyltransferase [Acinetobacter sp. FDAARGOS_515]RSC23543.1 site-specific DNA-methyltransferase [Acinetobacter sp. FDAARGOS_515]